MNLGRLKWVSVLILVAHGLEMYWTVLPSVHHLHGGPVWWPELGFPLLSLGIILLVWRWRASRAPVVAFRDPRLPDALAFHL
jgi:hypothetical protein